MTSLDLGPWIQDAGTRERGDHLTTDVFFLSILDEGRQDPKMMMMVVN